MAREHSVRWPMVQPPTGAMTAVTRACKSVITSPSMRYVLPSHTSTHFRLFSLILTRVFDQIVVAISAEIASAANVAAYAPADHYDFLDSAGQCRGRRNRPIFRRRGRRGETRGRVAGRQEGGAGAVQAQRLGQAGDVRTRRRSETNATRPSPRRDTVNTSPSPPTTWRSSPVAEAVEDRLRVGMEHGRWAMAARGVQGARGRHERRTLRLGCPRRAGHASCAEEQQRLRPSAARQQLVRANHIVPRTRNGVNHPRR